MYEAMGQREAIVKMQALAFLYDKLRELPTWVQQLTPGQMEQLAALLTRWQAATGQAETVRPLAEVEKREIWRALALHNGDVCAAARALGIGKTTFYRYLKAWGFTASDWRTVYQAAALGDARPARAERARDADMGRAATATM